MNKMNSNDCHQSESGYVIVTVALLLTVLLGFAALSIDSGVLYSSRTSAQRIADAAALNGAATFVLNPLAAQPAEAVAYATQMAVGRTILGQPVDASEVSVNVDVVNRIVTVDIQRTEETYLGKAVGFDSAGISVRGVAEASQFAVGSDCVKPWFIPNSIFVDPGPTGAVCDACEPGSPLRTQFLVDGSGNLTPHTISMIQSEQQIRIKPQRPANALESAQFYAIQLGNGPGGDVYRENIAGCAGTDVLCRQCYGVETGNMVGPTAQGVRDLIGSPADVFVSANPPLFGNPPSDTSPGLVIAPIWDICNQTGSCPATPFCPAGSLADHGANVQLRVIGFAMIFIEGVSGSDVVGRLISVNPCGAVGGGGGGAPGSNLFAVPLRLVRLPNP